VTTEGARRRTPPAFQSVAAAALSSVLTPPSLQAVAEAQFAQYLEKQGAQLVGEDVDGQTYDFRFRFWLNNQSRMYLIEGCLEMIKKYKLQKGDVIVFARKPDGTLVVGGRPAGPVRR
jgi:hypothetical protein